MYQTIRYEKNGNIGIATINRPEALNALNSTVISELEQVISLAVNGPGGSLVSELMDQKRKQGSVKRRRFQL